MNRILYAVTFALGLSLVVADDAFAGKKGDGGGDAAADGKGDGAYAPPEFKPTKIPEFDDVFTKAKAPIQTLIDTRRMVDAAQARVNTGLGVATTMTFADALTELKTKGEGKINVAASSGKFPKLAAGDAVPADVTTAINEFNGAMDDLEKASQQLAGITSELTTLATTAAGFVPKAPDAAKSAGLKATEIPGVASATGSNVKSLDQAKDEAAKLATTLDGMVSSITSTFGAK